MTRPPQRRVALVLAAAGLAMGATIVVSTVAAHADKPGPDRPAAADPAFLAQEQSAADPAPSSAADAALREIQAHISSYVAAHGMRYSFGSYLDPRTGAVVLETDAPDDVVAQVTASGIAAGVQIDVRRGEPVADH